MIIFLYELSAEYVVLHDERIVKVGHRWQWQSAQRPVFVPRCIIGL